MGVTVNNGSGSKVDYYAARTVDYDVQLGGDGEAIGTANVTIANDAPTHGEPRYVIGPYVHGAHAGDNIPLTTVWCHASCELESATSDGEQQIGLAAGSENGVPWLRDYRTIPAGHTGTLSLVWRSSGVWEGNSSGGSYELILLGQPTIRPTDVTATIACPRRDGHRVDQYADGGGRWDGNLARGTVQYDNTGGAFPGTASAEAGPRRHAAGVRLISRRSERPGDGPRRAPPHRPPRARRSSASRMGLCDEPVKAVPPPLVPLAPLTTVVGLGVTG